MERILMWTKSSLFLCFIWVTAAQRLPEENIINVTGNYMIGGIFSAHADYDRTNGTCLGYNLPGMIHIQAMIYAIEELANPLLPNGSKLGYEIVDDCYGIDLAMEASIRFLMGNTVETRKLWIRDYKSNRNPGKKSIKPAIPNPVIAVVGAANSDMSTAVASVLSVNSIPQISYSATSPELSDKTRYPSFLRTIPPDDAQVAAMADIVQYFNWTWIAVIATDDSYGRFALQGLKDIFHKRGICLAAEDLIDTEITEESVGRALDHLQSTDVIKNAHVIILICAGVRVQQFFDIALARNFTGRTWLASESWGIQSFAYNKYQPVIKGSIGLHVNSPNTSTFISEILNTKFCNVNKWLQQWLNTAPKLPSGPWKEDNCSNVLGAHPGWGTKHDKDFDGTFHNQFIEVPQVVDAVLAITNSLKSVILRGSNLTVTGSQVLENLYKLAFNNSQGQLKRFDKNGEIISGYTITNLKKVPIHLEFLSVGFWNGTGWTKDSILNPDAQRNRLKINTSKIIWRKGAGVVPNSSCNDECTKGTYKISSPIICCWTCALCAEGTYSDEMGMSTCKPCKKGMRPNPDYSDCVYIETYVDWRSKGEIGALIIAGVGFIGVAAVSVIFFIYRRTPVVICSNVPLTFTLLFLLAIGFLLPFLFVLKPSPALCSAESILFGLVFSTVMAIFLVKTRHVLLIFTAKLSDTLSMMNQRGIQRRELWQSAAFAALALGVAAIYLLISPPSPVAHQADCGKQWRNLQIFNFAYLTSLSIAATYAAFRARNLPENYNETNNISITTLLLLVVWVASLPTYFRVSVLQRTLILSWAIDIAGIFILLLMFGPKVYIIYFEPQKNTPVYVSKMNMIHIWKQHNKQEMKEKRKSERRKSSEETMDRKERKSRQRFKTRPSLSLTGILPDYEPRDETEPRLISMKCYPEF